MRSVCLNALIVTAAISFGACAAGSVIDGSPSAATGASTNDASTGTQPVNGSEDASAPVVTPTPPAEDAGPPAVSEDSGGATDDAAAPADDAGPIVAVDSGPPPVSPTGAACGSSSKYFTEWLIETAAGSTATCASGTDCSSTQCCYGGGSGVGLCVPL